MAYSFLYYVSSLRACEAIQSIKWIASQARNDVEIQLTCYYII